MPEAVIATEPSAARASVAVPRSDPEPTAISNSPPSEPVMTPSTAWNEPLAATLTPKSETVPTTSMVQSCGPS